MEFRLRSKERKLYDRIQRLGHWHEHFAFWPVKLSDEHGIIRYVWLKRVMRKYRIDSGNKDEIVFVPHYKDPEELSQAILANENNINELCITGYAARVTYRELCMDLRVEQG